MAGPSADIDVARELVGRAIGKSWILGTVNADDDLLAAGVSSAEMLRVALACEEVIGRGLRDGELEQIFSLSSIAALLRAGA